MTRTSLAAVALFAMVLPCVQPAAAQRAEPSLYVRMGGQPALDAIVADALVRVAADPRLAAARRSACFDR